MKNNRWNFVTAFADFTAGICFACLAALQAEMLTKVLYGIASIGFLAGGAGFFCAYRRKNDRQ